MMNLNQGILSSLQIPLPDLPTQRAIVAEIEAERALVNANRELIRRMEAKIKAAIDRVWGGETADNAEAPTLAAVDAAIPQTEMATAAP